MNHPRFPASGHSPGAAAALGPETGAMRPIQAFLRDENGTTAVEYGLVASLIGVVAIASLTLLGDELDEVFDCIENQLSGNDCS